MREGRRHRAVPALLALLPLLTSGCVGLSGDGSPSPPPPAAVITPLSREQPPPPQKWATYVAEPGPSGRITFGFPLCTEGKGRVIISKVEARKERGTGFRIEGIRLVTYKRSEGDTLASDNFPPPPRPSDQESAIPGDVPTACGDPVQGSEIQVGMSGEGDAGGGWDGAVVTFVDDTGATGTIEIPYRMFLCGSATQAC